MSIFDTLREEISPKEVVERYREVKGDKARCVATDH